MYEGVRKANFLSLPPVESPVGFEVPFDPTLKYKHKGSKGLLVAQFTWEVNSLELTPGIYRAQFVVHDGDGDLAINCITIQI